MSKTAAFAPDRSAIIYNNLFDYGRSSFNKDFIQKDVRLDATLKNHEEDVIPNIDCQDLQQTGTYTTVNLHQHQENGSERLMAHEPKAMVITFQNRSEIMELEVTRQLMSA